MNCYDGHMTITQYEQSGLIITSKNGQTLAIDIGALTPIEQLADMTVDAMLISHIHADHCSAPQVQTLSPNMLYAGAECLESLQEEKILVTTIAANDTFSSGDFTITPFDVDHGPNAPQVPQQNFGFLIEVDESVIYFAGDMYTQLDIDVSEISADAVCVPVGGHFTFDATEAFAFVQQFESIKTIYPMHYEAVGPIDVAGKEKFVALAHNLFTVV